MQTEIKRIWEYQYLDKIEFKILLQETMKYTHYIINKGSIQEENITIINTYAPNIGAPQYIGQILTILKVLLTVNKIMVGDFKTPLKPMDRSSRQKINRET